jgi:hypothetical protein
LEAFERQPKGQPKIPVDAHVHFHRRRFVEPTLDAAAKNFSGLTPPASPLLGMLLLAESTRERVFERLDFSKAPGRWLFRPVPGEPQSVTARREDQEIVIVCGRQIRCANGLEVLALGTTARFPEGRGPVETIAQVRHDGAVPVFPWGFGKWLGRARGVVSDLFSGSPPHTFFAGDNGGRLQVLDLPRPLKVASRHGFRVLPGTDPFPFGSDYRRVGSFGFLADFVPDPIHPWRSFQRWLEDNGGTPEPYGHALGVLRFAYNQAWIQVRNRVLERGAA